MESEKLGEALTYLLSNIDSRIYFLGKSLESVDDSNALSHLLKVCLRGQQNELRLCARDIRDTLASAGIINAQEEGLPL